MDRREPLHAELPEPETTHVMAPIPLYPSEMTCRECNALMLPFTWEDNSEWRCTSTVGNERSLSLFTKFVD